MERIPRRQYTAEFKREAVKLVLEQGIGVREAARRLDLPVGSLRNWLDAARAGKPLASETVRPVTDLEAENTRLKQEVAPLKMEKEILKNRLRGEPPPIIRETRGATLRGTRTVAVKAAAKVVVEAFNRNDRQAIERQFADLLHKLDLSHDEKRVEVTELERRPRGEQRAVKRMAQPEFEAAAAAQAASLACW